MKKKKNSKQQQSNPNQLSFDFFRKDSSIDVHIPKSASTVFNTHFTTTKRLAIKLAEA